MDTYEEQQYQEYFQKNADPKQVERRAKQAQKVLAGLEELKKIDVNTLLSIAKIGDAIRDARRIVEDLAVFGKLYQKTFDTYDFERSANLYDIVQSKHHRACCPSHGAFIAWKVCCTKDYAEVLRDATRRPYGNIIARILVYSDSKRGFHGNNGLIIADHTRILDAQNIETGESVDITKLYSNSNKHLESPYYGTTYLGVDRYELLSWLNFENIVQNELELKDETTETE